MANFEWPYLNDYCVLDETKTTLLTYFCMKNSPASQCDVGTKFSRSHLYKLAVYTGDFVKTLCRHHTTLQMNSSCKSKLAKWSSFRLKRNIRRDTAIQSVPSRVKVFSGKLMVLRRFVLVVDGRLGVPKKSTFRLQYPKVVIAHLTGPCKIVCNEKFSSAFLTKNRT